MVHGLSLTASPSTWTGMVRVVTILASLHWVMQWPEPPACSSGSWYVVSPTTSAQTVKPALLFENIFLKKEKNLG